MIFSILQNPFDPVFRPMQGATDGTFMHAAHPGNLWDGKVVKIISRQSLFLQFRQLMLHSVANALQLRLFG